MRAARSATLA